MNIQKIAFIRINRKELLIIISLLMLALLSYLFIRLNGQGAKVQIEISQELYGVYDLNKDQEITVTDNDGHILLKCLVKNGQIRVLSSQCPDKICIEEGSIEMNGQTIVCLPNQVVIQVIDDNEDIDGVLK